MTSAEPGVLLLDTSAAIALVNPSHQFHDAARQLTRTKRLGLSGHAIFECYSVLTRLPPPGRLTPVAAARLIAANFPASVPPTDRPSHELIELFASRGLAGGSVYDALVGSAAAAALLPLLTFDRRADPIYRALGVELLSW